MELKSAAAEDGASLYSQKGAMIKNPSPEANLPVLTGIDPKRYYLGVLGPLALGLSLGLQATMTAFMLLGPSNGGEFLNQLTEYGKTLARPEHELAIYAIGILFTLAGMLAAEWWWRSRLKHVAAEHLGGFMTYAAILQGVAATSSMVLYLLLLSSRYVAHGSGLRQPAGPFDQLTMFLPGVMAVVWVALDMDYGFPHLNKVFDWSNQWRSYVSRLLFFTMPVFIVLVISVPPGMWTDLAGQFYLTDRCHHLNFFMMGPALSFAHGKAFGTEIYSQYGIGWPIISSLLSHFSALTYGNLVGLEVVCGCIYYIALYFLLRSWFGQEVWAAIGVILALSWQIFSGLDQYDVIWLFPSSTMMRHPMDIWFFLAMMMHLRSGRMFWIAVAGLVSAFGIFFETETGVYLLATFFVYWALHAGLAPGEGQPTGGRDGLFPPFLFYSTVAATLLPLLFYASRGTLLTRAFWQGWTEPLIRYGVWGIGALPIAELPDGSLMFFLFMLAVYLAAIGHAVIRSLRHSAGKDEIFLAAVAVYGLALLLLFVNRSHPYNLYHSAVPFAIVLTALVFHCRQALAGVLRHSVFPYILTGGLIVLLLTKAEFMCYPSLLGFCFWDPIPRGSLSLMSTPRDISGLPLSAGGVVQEFNDISSAIRTLTPDGNNIAILDSDDTLLYCATNVKPWSRYASLFHMALTKQSINDIQNNLLRQPPEYVVIRGQNSFRPARWEFVWGPLYEVVKSRYVLYQTVGSYEIWLLSKQS